MKEKKHFIQVFRFLLYKDKQSFLEFLILLSKAKSKKVYAKVSSLKMNYFYFEFVSKMPSSTIQQQNIITQDQMQTIFNEYVNELSNCASNLSVDTEFIDLYDVINSMDLLEDGLQLFETFGQTESFNIATKLADLVLCHIDYIENEKNSDAIPKTETFHRMHIIKYKDQFVKDMLAVKDKIQSFAKKE